MEYFPSLIVSCHHSTRNPHNCKEVILSKFVGNFPLRFPYYPLHFLLVCFIMVLQILYSSTCTADIPFVQEHAGCFCYDMEYRCLPCADIQKGFSMQEKYDTNTIPAVDLKPDPDFLPFTNDFIFSPSLGFSTIFFGSSKKR